MRKKPRTTNTPILRDCILVEVTDPVEFAALDERCRAAKWGDDESAVAQRKAKGRRKR